MSSLHRSRDHCRLDAGSGVAQRRGVRLWSFFISKDLWNLRLVSMRVPEREELAERIRAWRTRGDEAWVTAAGNRVTGPIVIASVRPSLDPHP